HRQNCRWTLRGQRRRHRPWNSGTGADADFRAVPSGRCLEYEGERRNWSWPLHCQADRRNARWQHLGGVRIRAGLDFPYERSGPTRFSKICPRRKRILVVEDQADLRGFLRGLFTSAGYIVMEAVDGATGIAMAKSDRPCIVLMAIKRPVMDG